ncbi:MAG TPA: hypothetical protein VI818_03030 [Candidatus Thermoplasmatota archaeon]|nr:hypothetical protein [Candidatus Thermoplasmatota archaeon]
MARLVWFVFLLACAPLAAAEDDYRGAGMPGDGCIHYDAGPRASALCGAPQDGLDDQVTAGAWSGADCTRAYAHYHPAHLYLDADSC